MKPVPQRQREQIFATCSAFGLSRSERLEVAAYVLGREVESFNDLDTNELARMIDAMQGAAYVATIKMAHAANRTKNDTVLSSHHYHKER